MSANSLGTAATAAEYCYNGAMIEIATLGGGCYWCFEAFYQIINGVTSVVSGYSDGHTNNPTATQVYGGGTGHAEVVQITFDNSIISYHDILEIFFTMHDPTTLNRQGNDIGDEYRSVILYHNDTQRQLAGDLIKKFVPTLWKNPVVTQVVPFTKFWPADESNQDFYNKNLDAGYCQVIINPKIQKLRKKFAKKIKSS